MYTAFYGLREKPFALLPDPRYLFLAESHREALAHLLYGIDQGEGFIAVTGEVGTGKTTLCRTLLERLGSETEVAFLFNPSRSGVELLQDISAEFGLDSARRSRSELGIELNRFLLRKKQEGRRVLLIIDEAQNLSHDTLEQVRLLSNLETSSSKLIQILLLGQPELDQKLDSSQLRQLRQRISVRWGLRPLAAKETHEYVRHRLRVAAGTDRNIFNDGALREIHRRSRGVPRIVNVLCDRALLAGYVARASTVGPALVKKAAREIPDVQRSALFARSRSARSKFFGIGAALALAFATGWFFAAGGPAWDRAGELWPSAFPGASSTPNAGWDRDVSSAPPFEPLSLESVGASVELLPLQSDWQPVDQTSVHTVAPDVSGVSTEFGRALAAAPVRPGSEVVTAPAAPDETATASITTAASATAPIATALIATAPGATAPIATEPIATASDATAPIATAPDASASMAVLPEVPRRALQPNAVAGHGALAPGGFLAAIVANEEPAATRLEALNVVLGSFGRAGFESSPSGDASMLAGLRQRGLAVLVFERANLAALRSLNHPALLRVSGDDHRTRILALMKLDGDRAYLYGLSGGGPLRVPLGELEQQWRGGAWVVWNDFEDVRPVLAFGEKGTAVEWLQKSLAELGYYEGEASGLFDRSTSNGLRAFQHVWRLQVDGMAGPRTRMVLYDLLDEYAVPRLAERDVRFEAAGEGAG